MRRSIALLVKAFALALIMIAFLYLSAVFGLVSGETTFETIRRATFFVVGLAPLVFLVGLLHARLARSAVGDLMVELQADPTPADLRDALSRALRDPSLSLVYWLPEFETFAGLDGQPAQLAADDGGRAMTLIDHDGVTVAALLHDPSLDDEPELWPRRRPGPGSQSRMRGCTSSFALASRNCVARARGWWTSPTRSGNGWSATFTTVRSSGWSRSPSN